MPKEGVHDSNSIIQMETQGKGETEKRTRLN